MSAPTSAAAAARTVTITVNGTTRSATAEVRTLLSDFLRHGLGLTGETVLERGRGPVPVGRDGHVQQAGQHGPVKRVLLDELDLRFFHRLSLNRFEVNFLDQDVFFGSFYHFEIIAIGVLNSITISFLMDFCLAYCASICARLLNGISFLPDVCHGPVMPGGPHQLSSLGKK